jgi:hypothetical protein
MNVAYRGEFIVFVRERAGGLKTATMGSMVLATLAMRVLEVMFFVGLVGSSVVVLISFLEDGKELFGKD